MTLWWMVGACNCSFSEYLVTWKHVCTTIRISTPIRHVINKISTWTLSLMKSPPIINDLYLLTGFHEAWLFPNFKYSHMGDKAIVNTQSFQERHLLVRYYLMISDLKFMKEGWRTHDYFKRYVSTLNELKEEEKELQQISSPIFLLYRRFAAQKLQGSMVQPPILPKHLLFTANCYSNYEGNFGD